WNCQTASSAAGQLPLPDPGLLPEEAVRLSAVPGCRHPSLVLSPAAVSAARKCRFRFSAWQPPARFLYPIIQQNSSHCELSAQRTSCKNSMRSDATMALFFVESFASQNAPFHAFVCFGLFNGKSFG